MIPSEKAHSGISPRGAAKNAAQKGKFEGDIDMSLSNGSIGADAPMLPQRGRSLKSEMVTAMCWT